MEQGRAAACGPTCHLAEVPMKITSIDRADAASGILFLLFGLFFGSQSLGLEIGTAFRMGPGFFPLILSGVLMCFGLLVLFNAFKTDQPGDMGSFAWRGLLFILPALILGEPLGYKVQALTTTGDLSDRWIVTVQRLELGPLIINRVTTE